MLKGLLREGMLPWDEQSPNAIMIHVGGQGTPWFIGRAENFTDAGLLIGTAPLSAAEVVAKIDAEEARRAAE